MAEKTSVDDVGFTDTSTVTSKRGGRAFFQARLAIFGFCLFVLGAISWAALALAYYFGSGSDEHDPFSFGGVLHLTNTLLTGTLWLVTPCGANSARAGY